MIVSNTLPALAEDLRRQGKISDADADDCFAYANRMARTARYQRKGGFTSSKWQRIWNWILKDVWNGD